MQHGPALLRPTGSGSCRTAPPPLRPRAPEPGQGAFADQLLFELGQLLEDAEHEAPGHGGGIDLCALTGEHPQAHAAGREALEA